jgi:hypothetical protein
VSFPDRFEILEPLREGEEQTFRARERATGRVVEVHFPGQPGDLPTSGDVIEQGSHDGKPYVIRPAAAALDTAGAWRIKSTPTAAPPTPPAPVTPGQEPGDFTRMFQLRQAPEPAPLPLAKPAASAPAAAPGEFTRAFQRPAAAPIAAPEGASAPGQAGDFTRMFQQPGSEAGKAIASDVPQPPAASSEVVLPEASGTAQKGISKPRIIGAILLLFAIIVLLVMRRLY